MTPEEQVELCEKCEFVDKLSADIGFNFLGCRYKPYKGKWVAEIETCPKKKIMEGLIVGMTKTRMIDIIKNLPSDGFTKQDKKNALILFAKSGDVKAINKTDLQNAIIYLLDMVDFEKKDWNGI